jgi:Lrp/AsnC family transcriptional regulator for asnA, asnC and gidA
MDAIDYNLILELQKDSRRSNRQLARLLGVSEATVRRRIKDLVDSHTIELTAVPDPSMVGMTMWGFMGLQVELSQVDAVADQLASYPEVQYVGICSGSYQILISVMFRSPERLALFITNELARIPGMIRTDTLVSLRSLKRTLGWLQADASSLVRPT